MDKIRTAPDRWEFNRLVEQPQNFCNLVADGWLMPFARRLTFGAFTLAVRKRSAALNAIRFVR